MSDATCTDGIIIPLGSFFMMSSDEMKIVPKCQCPDSSNKVYRLSILYAMKIMIRAIVNGREIGVYGGGSSISWAMGNSQTMHAPSVSLYQSQKN